MFVSSGQIPDKYFSLTPCKSSTFITTKFTMTYHPSYQNIKMMDVILNMTPRRFVVNLVSFRRNTFFGTLHFCTLKINYNFLINFDKCILGYTSWQNCKKRLLASPFFCLSVCVSIRPSACMKQLQLNLIFVYFSKIGWEKMFKPNMKIIRVLYMKTNKYF
jgi:hypothetical protein